MWTYTEGWLKSLPLLANAGGSGYWWIDPYGLILGTGKPTVIFELFFFGKTNMTPINAIWDPLYTLGKSMNPTQLVNFSLVLPQASTVLPQPGGADPSGQNVIVGTRLYAQSYLEMSDGPANYVKAFDTILTEYPSVIEGHLTAGGKVAANADKVDSALNPSWRRALGEILLGVSWNDTTPVSVQQAMVQSLTDVQVPILAAVDPTMGTYTNEANPYEPQWQTVFWGTNYPRLLEVKNKWDPNGLFRCNRCVGSERWDSTGNCPA